MLLKSLWYWAVNELIITSDTPHLDAELLLALSLGCTRAQLYGLPSSTSLNSSQLQHLQVNIMRRKVGEPMAYLLGEREFWSIVLEVSKEVLIPRPETELLVQQILALFNHEALKVADLGTGSGAIALALAIERPQWHFVATDYSRAALAIAKRNKEKHHIRNVELRQGNWCQGFIKNERFDVVVSNPPYLAKNDPHFHSQPGLLFEPKLALIAEKKGLHALETIICQSREHLLPGGHLFLEHGCDQAKDVTHFFSKYGYSALKKYEDLAGHLRVMSGKWH
jgi:release factor glutamine methyltransferase